MTMRTQPTCQHIRQKSLIVYLLGPKTGSNGTLKPQKRLSRDSTIQSNECYVKTPAKAFNPRIVFYVANIKIIKKISLETKTLSVRVYYYSSLGAAWRIQRCNDGPSRRATIDARARTKLAARFSWLPTHEAAVSRPCKTSRSRVVMLEIGSVEVKRVFAEQLVGDVLRLSLHAYLAFMSFAFARSRQ